MYCICIFYVIVFIINDNINWFMTYEVRLTCHIISIGTKLKSINSGNY